MKAKSLSEYSVSPTGAAGELCRSASVAELRSALECGGGSQQPIEQIKECGLANEALRLLRIALRDAEPRIRAEACLALDYLDDPAAIADLRPLLADTDIMVSVRAADALCHFGKPAAALVPRLVEILRQGEAELPVGKDRVQPSCMMLQMPEGRYHAARILSFLGPEAAPARDELRSAMKSASAIVRAAAARALAGIGEPADVYMVPLRQALHDVNVQSSRERVWAAEALVELGEPPGPVVAVLAELVTDEDWTAAALAMRLLGQLGPAAAAAVSALRAAQSSGRDGVTEAATAALEQIGATDDEQGSNGTGC
jgi:HEAT repeat protein